MVGWTRINVWQADDGTYRIEEREPGIFTFCTWDEPDEYETFGSWIEKSTHDSFGDAASCIVKMKQQEDMWRMDRLKEKEFRKNIERMIDSGRFSGRVPSYRESERKS